MEWDPSLFKNFNVTEFTFPPGFDLLSHRLEVPLHPINTNRNAIDQQERFRVFGKHRRNTPETIFPNSGPHQDARIPISNWGMTSYLGFPITWPNGDIFGTICVLDCKRHDYNYLYRKLLLHRRDVLQTDLRA